ncbi:hypothetical protein GQ43DRAFT_117695 [Delitschia confertaspora ATCC 74209]|uniref:Uncharacterized protein n=1 Tax=Delitschia confertaspora ATCC 74209 TaxID=1513339 RepID=A0A9P4MTU4_9PLEO|nr:hypothetical protein GQ43DRAFT_117695 [Delitschia confertaspora ATCC 74209]
MPILLHPRLRTGIIYEPLEPHSDDRIEGDLGYNDDQNRPAKRRRVEHMAKRYLSGEAPVLLSASLRGPFGKSWKNPWRTTPRRDKGTSGAELANSTDNNDSRVGSREVQVRESFSYGDRARVHGSSVTVQQAPDAQLPPVCSLMVEEVWNLSRYGQERNSGLAPRNGRGTNSDGDNLKVTQSLNRTRKGTNRQSRLHNDSHWLKRTSMPSQIHRLNDSPSASPTPARFLQPRASAYGKRGLSSHHGERDPVINSKTKARFHDSHDSDLGHRERSSLSSSVAINSPRRQQRATPNVNKPNDLDDNSTSREGLSEDWDIQEQQTTDPELINSADSINGFSQTPDRESTVLVDFNEQHTRGLAQPSTTGNLASKSPGEKGPRRKNSDATRPALMHTHVASPAPASSIGFSYRRTKERKAITDTAPHLTETTASVETLPDILEHSEEASEEPVVIQAKDGSMAEGTGRVEEAMNQNSVAPPVELTTSSATGVTVTSGVNQGSLRSSRASDFSTQAAIALARLEFQEESFLSIDPEFMMTPNAHIRDGTSKGHADTSTITPFYAINEEISRAPATTTFSQAGQMSTQDLFMAASPFAFSTVKKTTQPSSLRFALLPSESYGADLANKERKSPFVLRTRRHTDFPGDETVTCSPAKAASLNHTAGDDTVMFSPIKAPTGSRTPLKDKNVGGDIRRVTYGSQREFGPQPWTSQNASPELKLIQTTHFNDQLGSDSFDLDTGLDYVDRFLKSVGGLSQGSVNLEYT